jgi:predicted DCC family thiol-disulfide oxidoreductase YuxK
MLFDGDCHFCSRWIERWAEITAGAVEYQPFQTAGAQFPEIPPQNFNRAVQLIEPTGVVSSGAEAVFRALGYSRSHAWLLLLYRDVPGFAPTADAIYDFIARRRTLASAGTRLLWGDDVRRPTFSIARDWFLRSLGVIYLIAFVSLWVQVDGLIGRNGILPIAEFLPAAREQLGSNAIAALPTLCWFNTSDTFLHFLCGAGAVLSVLLIVGVAPVLTLLLLFASYLSLTVAGQTFLSFQWDILLLETGFLAIFIAPVRWSQWRSEETRVSRAGLFLIKLLLFKLMLMSGVVKLTSGDSSWLNLTALDYHYWTQPLPTVLGWWADKNPEWLKKATVAGTLFVEIAVPFFIWAPRRFRVSAAALLIALQVGIALTGNYSFFNLLTIALCLLLIDDAVWPKRRPVAAVGDRGSLPAQRSPAAVGGRGYRIAHYAAIVVLVVTLPLNAMLVHSAFSPEAIWPRSIEVAYSYVERFRIVNGYGLFRVMTKTRPEIVVEGSSDGITWLPYRFRWKPGELNLPPRWVAPHQPRLDWQMWFAALSSYRQNPWFVRFVERLLSNSPAVVALLAENPFPDTPPRYIRAISYEYRFTILAERRRTGDWWTRGEPNRYLPSVSLADFER